MAEALNSGDINFADLPAVLTVEEAGRLFRLSRGSAFAAVKRGDIPAVRIGRRLLVPKAKLAAMLGEAESKAAG